VGKSGVIDGELFRIKALNLDNAPSLQQVKEPLFTIAQVVLSKQEININGWKNSPINYIWY
jgi:hypothetical protein